ncbi:MAG: hypothetical protein IKP40_08435 [Clostridia bacterium]|nr:hypothetical protein [Clostridia bacterium]
MLNNNDTIDEFPLPEDAVPPLTADLEELADLLAPRIDERLGELARQRWLE